MKALFERNPLAISVLLSSGRLRNINYINHDHNGRPLKPFRFILINPHCITMPQSPTVEMVDFSLLTISMNRN